MSVSDALRQRGLEEQNVLMAATIIELTARVAALEEYLPELAERVGTLQGQLEVAQRTKEKPLAAAR